MANFKFNPLLEKLRITFSAGEGEQKFFKNSSGLKLFYRYFLPVVVKKIVLVSHVAGGNGDYLEDCKIARFKDCKIED